MKKTAVLLMLMTVASKILGFTRDITLSYFYGASDTSDAYLISLTIPAIVFGLIGSGLSIGYIPMYSEIEKKHGELEGNRYTNNLINILFLICSLILVLGLTFTTPMVKIIASGFEGETLSLAIKFTKVSLFGVYFMGITYVFKGYLQIKDNYVVPALVGLPFNILIICSIFLSVKTNILVLSLGSVIATGSQLFILLPSIYKEGYRYKFVIDFKDEHIRKMLYIALPVIVGSSVNQINLLIDRTIASSISVGGISSLNYANRLHDFIQGLFVVSIATVMYPMISKMAADENIDGLKSSVSEAISSINLLVIPATIGAMVFAEPIVKLLFGRGAFDELAISMTSNALFFASIGMIGFGLRDILSRAFYSMQDTKTPMINAALAMLMNIVLNIVLSRFMGIGGLALATSISALFCTGLLFISLRRKIGSFGMKGISISFIKILFSSVFMGIVAKLCFEALLKVTGTNISLVVSVGLGALVYIVLIYFMKIEEVDSIVNMLKKKLKIV